MKKVLLLLIVIILSGCSIERHIAWHLQKHPLPAIHDTTYIINTFIRDTIVYEQIPGDTVVDSIPIPVEIDLPYMELKRISTWSEATAWIRDNRLGLELVQYDTVIQILLEAAIVEHRDTVKIITTVEVPVLVKPKPFWKHGFFVLAGLIVVSMILLFVFLFRKK